MIAWSVVDLPAPFGADQPDDLARADLSADVAAPAATVP